MTEAIFELKGVVAKYGELRALDDVSFRIEKGDVVGVVGPNGGGKTTLLNVMLGNLPIVAGSVKVFGRNIREFKEWHRIGYVAQHAIQFDPIFPATVEEIVSLGCLSRKHIGKRLSAEDKEEVKRALELVDLLPQRNRRIGQLSGGQKQRIFIAKALVKRPEVLILDEATAGLDICIQDRFIDLIRRMKAERDITVVTVSHDLSGVLCQANKLAVVNKKVYWQEIDEKSNPEIALRQAYGEHFTFVFHSHHHCEQPPIKIKEG
ncbi:MAG: putative branched-chain amino acid transport ATP-binding protein LivG [Methanomassiliicoccales archaeon PtaU1.Bin124]|nr:MAG: putative branched-chain amino acid transport ATP-binding protein LivG [Methanomassiliicoccales archaeon PtaU1.Bin124]